MEQLISKIYTNLPVERKIMLFGVEIPSLKDFVSIMKTDDEFTLQAFLKLFSKSADGYPEDILVEAFNSVEPLKPEDIFSEKFSNVEVRAAILKYVSPEKVFLALKSKVIDKCTMTKKYPKYIVKNLETKKDSEAVNSKDIKITFEEKNIMN